MEQSAASRSTGWPAAKVTAAEAWLEEPYQLSKATAVLLVMDTREALNMVVPFGCRCRIQKGAQTGHTAAGVAVFFR